MKLFSHFVREQGTSSIREYRKRVYRLAAIYVGLVASALVVDGLIVVRGQFFVTLTQRSNVETLTLAVILLLFTYLSIVALPGAWGALHIFFYNLPAWLGADSSRVEARKQAALKPSQGQPNAVYLNCLVCRQGDSDQSISIPLQDAAGSLGVLVIDGAKITHEQGVHHHSNSLFAYFVQQIQRQAQARAPHAKVDIVQWESINDESALQYESIVTFSRNLAHHLGSGPLWPQVELTDEDIGRLKAQGSDLCPILRNEAHLPDLEYEVEHRLPIIPEPLAFVVLSRREQRADPEVSLGCALVVSFVILGFVLLFLWMPPWVPPK